MKCMLQLLATAEFNVFQLNDIITARSDAPAVTSLTQIYLSQVTNYYRITWPWFPRPI